MLKLVQREELTEARQGGLELRFRMWGQKKNGSGHGCSGFAGGGRLYCGITDKLRRNRDGVAASIPVVDR